MQWHVRKFIRYSLKKVYFEKFVYFNSIHKFCFIDLWFSIFESLQSVSKINCQISLFPLFIYDLNWKKNLLPLYPFCMLNYWKNKISDLCISLNLLYVNWTFGNLKFRHFETAPYVCVSVSVCRSMKISCQFFVAR